MNYLELARRLAYKHLSGWIEKNKDAYDFSSNPELSEYMLAMDFLLNNNKTRYATPEEYQAASVLEEILAIEAYPNLDDILQGETKTMGDILYDRLKGKIETLENISASGVASIHVNQKKPVRVRDRQYVAIMAAIKQLDYASNEIPDRGKANIKKICLSQPKLFVSENAFTGAWKDGRKLNLFKMANIEKYR